MDICNEVLFSLRRRGVRHLHDHPKCVSLQYLVVVFLIHHCIEFEDCVCFIVVIPIS